VEEKANLRPMNHPNKYYTDRKSKINSQILDTIFWFVEAEEIKSGGGEGKIKTIAIYYILFTNTDKNLNHDIV